ncbi:MAG: 2-acyl-glycerophospho-ethanolamine acyltransferase [Candidatus Methanolliviera sp. GoM_oil]|nr:MAG: 2-acyl-glycerophospho-ethanolamine acyltransferase [Candidatus Methanolliviera sp. GoM_oil]
MKFISRDDLESIQEKKVIDQVNFAYANSPFYKRKFDEAGIEPKDIKSMDDFFEKVPFSSKQELIDSQLAHPPFGEFLSVPNEKIKLIFVSPGPIFEPHTEKDLQVLRNGLGKRIVDLGIGRGDVCQVTLSYHLMPAGFAIHIGAEAAGCTVIPAGTGESRMQVDVMRKAGTTIYVGTPSFLARIAEKAEEMKIDPRRDLKLRMGICIAEPLPPSLRTNLQRTFDIELFDVYGVAELGILAGECGEHDGMHVNEEDFIVEIIDPDTLERVQPGDEGEIVCTPLGREALPLIRYRTGDVSSITLEKCKCGREDARILGIRGRVGMLTKVKGVFIHPRQVGEVVEGYRELGRFQILVERPGIYDEMTIFVECKEIEKFEEWEEKLKEAFKEILRIKCDVKMVHTGEIPSDVNVLEDRRGHYAE